MFQILALLISIHLVQAKELEKVVTYGNSINSPFIKDNFSTFYDADRLKKQNSQHLEDLFLKETNLNFAGGNSRAKFIQIRGIGERSQYGSIPKNSVGVFLDHIDLSGQAGLIKPFYLNSIHILKGPQSQFFGDSSIAGNVLASSKIDSDVFEEQSLILNLGTQRKKKIGAAQLFFVGETKVYTGVHFEEDDGFIRNIYLNKNTNSRNEKTFFLNLKHDLKNTKIKFSNYFFNFKNGYDVWAFTPFSKKVTSDNPGEDNQTLGGHSLSLDHYFNKKNSLHIILSATNSISFYSYDEDWSNNQSWLNLEGFKSVYNYKNEQNRKNTFLHQKVFYSHKNDRLGLKFNAGLHTYQKKEKAKLTPFKNNIERDEKIETSYNSTHYALVFQTEHKLNKKLTHHSSFRLENQKIKYADSKNYTSQPKNTLYGWNYELNYKPNLKNSLNFSITKGFSGAGFNPSTHLDPKYEFYKPESLYNFEASWAQNTTLFDHKINIFYSIHKNKQIKSSIQEDALDPNSFTTFIGNADKSLSYGLELENLLFPNGALQFFINLGLLKASFRNYKYKTNNLNSRALPHAPLYSFKTGFNTKLHKKLSLTLVYSGKDSFYFSQEHNQKSSPYETLSASLTYQPLKTLSIKLWGENLFNKNYATRGFYFGLEPPLYEEKLYIQRGAPLRAGVEISFIY